MAIGWPSTGELLMLVRYKSGQVYGYYGVSRQRAVALAYRRKLYGQSIGHYINHVIKPNFTVNQIALFEEGTNARLKPGVMRRLHDA